MSLRFCFVRFLWFICMNFSYVLLVFRVKRLWIVLGKWYLGKVSFSGMKFVF